MCIKTDLELFKMLSYSTKIAGVSCSCTEISQLEESDYSTEMS